jgi:hypothetical protein
VRRGLPRRIHEGIDSGALLDAKASVDQTI